jgi:hypothetical protein
MSLVLTETGKVASCCLALIGNELLEGVERAILSSFHMAKVKDSARTAKHVADVGVEEEGGLCSIDWIKCMERDELYREPKSPSEGSEQKLEGKIAVEAGLAQESEYCHFTSNQSHA